MSSGSLSPISAPSKDCSPQCYASIPLCYSPSPVIAVQPGSLIPATTQPSYSQIYLQACSTIDQMTPPEVLRMASQFIPGNMILQLPPFRNGNIESWRIIVVEQIPRHFTSIELLSLLKPRGLEAARRVTDARLELRFLNHTSALLFYTQLLLNPVYLDNYDCLRASWVPTSHLQLDASLEQATRILNIRVSSSLSESSVSAMLWEKLSEFGTIESITLNPTRSSTTPASAPPSTSSSHASSNKLGADDDSSSSSGKTNVTHSWRVSFMELDAAINAKSSLNWDCVVSVAFGQDKALHKLHRQAAMLHLTKSPYDPANLQGVRYQEIVSAVAHQSLATLLVNLLSGGEMNIGNRCICISRLPPGTKLVEVCNTVRGGMIESVKLIEDRNICFVTFLEPSAAAQFWATYQMLPFYVNCERVRVGWGRNPGPLAPEIAAIVEQNVTRNVCIQLGDSDQANPASKLMNEEELGKLFAPFGTIEQVRFAADVGCSFITFTTLLAAAQAVDWARKSALFRTANVQYGKDRCAALPRTVLRTQEFAYQPILVNFLRRELPEMFMAHRQAMSPHFMLPPMSMMAMPHQYSSSSRGSISTTSPYSTTPTSPILSAATLNLACEKENNHDEGIAFGGPLAIAGTPPTEFENSSFSETPDPI